MSLHHNSFHANSESSNSNPDVRHIVHSGIGAQIVKCNVCNFMSVEFVHPSVINIIYETPPLSFIPKDVSKQQELHKQNCQNQSLFVKRYMPEVKERALFLGVGRAENAQRYCEIFNEVFSSDLVPQHNKLAGGCSGLRVLPFANIQTPDLFETFNLIILSNIFERVAFPLNLIRLCANLLKQGGRLLLEVPKMSESDVFNSAYGREEINFFSSKSLEKLIEVDGNFKIIKTEESIEPIALRDATCFGLQSKNTDFSNKRSIVRLILENKRHILNTNLVDIEQQDILKHLSTLSFALFVSASGLSRFSELTGETAIDAKYIKNLSLTQLDH